MSWSARDWTPVRSPCWARWERWRRRWAVSAGVRGASRGWSWRSCSAWQLGWASWEMRSGRTTVRTPVWWACWMRRMAPDGVDIVNGVDDEPHIPLLNDIPKHFCGADHIYAVDTWCPVCGGRHLKSPLP